MVNVTRKLNLKMKKYIAWCTDFFFPDYLNTPVKFQIKTAIDNNIEK